MKNTIFTAIAIILLTLLLTGTYLLNKISNDVQAINNTIISWDVTIQ